MASIPASLRPETRVAEQRARSQALAAVAERLLAARAGSDGAAIRA